MSRLFLFVIAAALLAQVAVPVAHLVADALRVLALAGGCLLLLWLFVSLPFRRRF